MLDQERQAELEMQQLLSSIPTSKFMARYDVMDKAIEALEKSIKRLKAFVRFLSLLSPTKYIEWMKQAYAQYTPGQNATATKVEAVKQPAPMQFDDSSLDKSKVATNTTTPAKRYLPTP